MISQFRLTLTSMNQFQLFFFGSAYTNDLHKRHLTTDLVFTFCGGAIFYKSKTQLLTTGSSTKAEFIYAHTDENIACYLCMVLKQLGAGL